MNEQEKRERLYHLLPAFYRLRDNAEGEPLRALLAIIQQEVEIVESDIEGLYDNWFVETADEWVLPYIGDLLDVTNLHTVVSAGVYSLRAYFANTLGYRQRKGTAAVLEQLANDIAGWEARVVEFFQLLTTTQHLNHLRPEAVRTPDLRNSNALDLLGSNGQVIRNANSGELLLDLYASKRRDSPFHTVPHTGEVRRIKDRQGHFNIPNVGIYLWRIQSYPLKKVAAREVGPNRYTFNQLGLDIPLFHLPQAEPEIAHIATETNVPSPPRLRSLYDEVEQHRMAIAAGEASTLAYFSTNPLLDVLLPDPGDPSKLRAVPVEEIGVCNLSDWTSPPAKKLYPTGAKEADGTAVMRAFTIRLAVDPHLGRLVFTKDNEPVEPPLLNYHYGFSGDIGGGPYNRSGSSPLQDNLVDPAMHFVARVDQSGELGAFTNLTTAVLAWQASSEKIGIIAITDSRSYRESLTGTEAIKVTAGRTLYIVAAKPFNPAARSWLELSGHRPHLNGNISIEGVAPSANESRGAVRLDGLLIEGQVRVLQGDLGQLVVQHCTIVPGRVSLMAKSASNTNLQIQVSHTICGGIELSEKIPRLTINDTLLDNAAGADINAPGAEVVIEHSTLLGEDDELDAPPAMRVLHASESIFTGRQIVERRQVGCVRFSVLPLDSRTPRRFRCQPDLALSDSTDTADESRAVLRLRPQFTSTTYGHPGYGQLSQACAVEIRTGAEDGSEMGCFSMLKQPQRETNLRAALDEYVPFGLQVGIFYVS